MEAERLVWKMCEIRVPGLGLWPPAVVVLPPGPIRQQWETSSVVTVGARVLLASRGPR